MSMWKSQKHHHLHSTVGFFPQMTLRDMKDYVATSADDNGNLWCHLEGCKDTYTPYRVNVWGLRTPDQNREDGRQMVAQQVTNILRHLEKAHGIFKHQVTEDVLPKRTPPFPGREYMSCSGLVSLGICDPCESAKGVYKSNLCTLASLSIRLELNWNKISYQYTCMNCL